MHLITGFVLNPFTVVHFLVTSVRHNGANTGFKSGYLTEVVVVYLSPSRQMTLLQHSRPRPLPSTPFQFAVH